MSKQIIQDIILEGISEHRVSKLKSSFHNLSIVLVCSLKELEAERCGIIYVSEVQCKWDFMVYRTSLYRSFMQTINHLGYSLH